MGKKYTFNPFVGDFDAIQDLTFTNIYGGTSGSIPFFGATGFLAEDNSNLFWDNTNKRLGVGTATPLQKIDIKQGHINFSQIIKPDSTFSLATNGAGNVPAGVLYYCITYVCSDGSETDASDAKAITPGVPSKIVLSSLPVSSDSRVVSKRIYRTQTPNSYYYRLVATIDNAVTSYEDDKTDGEVSSTVSFYIPSYSTNNTAGKIKINDNEAFFIGRQTVIGEQATNNQTVDPQIPNTIIGYQSGYSQATTFGGQNTFVGLKTGYSLNNTNNSLNTLIGASAFGLATGGTLNTSIGASSCYSGTGVINGITALGAYSGRYNTGDYNTYLGTWSGYNKSSSSYNTSVGSFSGYTSGGSYSTFLGYYAGKYETASQTLIIDSLDRGTEALGRSSALIYGTVNATPANQILVLGGGGNVGIGVIPGYKLEVASGDIGIDAGQYYRIKRGGDNASMGVLGFGATTNDLTLKTGGSTDTSRFALKNSGGVEMMTVLNRGNVGIGETIPLAKLHINGGTGTLATGLAFGDGDSGIYESADDTMRFATVGVDRFLISGVNFRGVNIQAGSIINEVSSSTNPTLIPNASYIDTGVGAIDSQLSLIAGGVEGIRITETAGNTNVDLKGSLNLAYRATTTTTTLDDGDYTLECTANSFTVNLPTAVGISGRVYSIKNTGTGTITVDGNGTETIDDELTQTISQWDNMLIMSNGSNYIII